MSSSVTYKLALGDHENWTFAAAVIWQWNRPNAQAVPLRLGLKLFIRVRFPGQYRIQMTIQRLHRR